MSYYLNRTARIQGIVASYYKLDYADMFAPTKDHFVCGPRHVAMYLTREITRQSLTEIGRRFRRDHSTVHSALRSVEKRLVKYKWLEAEMNKVRRLIERDDAARGSESLRDAILRAKLPSRLA